MNRPVQPRDRLIRIALGILVLLIGLAGSVGAASVTVRNYTAKIAAFQVYAFNKALTDSTFTTCNAIDGWSYGFLNAGEGSPNSVSDITYSGCSAINCGRASQYNPWITGFYLAESTDISNLLAENCRAEGCWELGFHFEVTPKKNDVILKNCISINNGQKKNVKNQTLEPDSSAEVRPCSSSTVRRRKI